VATVTTGSSVIGANVTYPVTCCLVSKTSVSWQARTVSTSVAGMASGIVYWIVLGF
jgi:hypothetical protein